MRRGFLSSMALLLAGTGLAVAQAPVPISPAVATPPAVAAQAPTAGPVPVAAPAPHTPYSPASPADIGPAPVGLVPGGPGEIMTCPGCSAGGGTCFDPYVPYKEHFYAGGEFLLWRFKDTFLPSVLGNVPIGTVSVYTNGITGNPVGGNTPQPVNGVAPTITLPVLAAVGSGFPGGPTVPFKDEPGMRVQAGWWLDDDQTVGIDALYYWIWQKTDVVNSVPTVTANPSSQTNFVNVPTGLSATVTIVPNGAFQSLTALSSTAIFIPVTSGQAIVNATDSIQMYGFEVNARFRKCIFGCCTLDCLTGWRYYDFEETLSETENTNTSVLIPTQTGTITVTTPTGQQVTGTATLPTFPFVPGQSNLSGGQTVFVDSIKTRNQFFGPQVGISYDWHITKCVYIDGWGKLALGDNHEAIDLLGYNITNNSSGTLTRTNGGLLVNQADSLKHRVFDRICVIPEFQINIGYEICNYARAYIGYNYQYISTVARPADQVAVATGTSTVTVNGQTANNPTLITGFKVHDTDMWIQGINMGLEIRY